MVLGKSAWQGISQATPQYVLQSARLQNGMGFGLRGLGDVTDLSSWTLDDAINAIQKGLVVLNSQELYQLNLDRLSKGLPAIPTQYAAPSVNLGIAGMSTPMLIGLAFLALMLLRK